MLENEATLPEVEPVSEAPMASTFLAVLGGVICEAPCEPRSPTENRGSMEGLS